VVSGYVTWSSTSCGLCPAQSVKTMTWLSERSGIASIGVARSAHQPQPERPRYSAITMKRFFSATSTSRLIMGHNTRHVARVRARAYVLGQQALADTRRL